MGGRVATAEMSSGSTLTKAGLGAEHVAACAFVAQMGDMERLDRMIAATEIRSAAALREIERHRAARVRDMHPAGDIEDVPQDATGRAPAFEVAGEEFGERCGGLA